MENLIGKFIGFFISYFKHFFILKNPQGNWYRWWFITGFLSVIIEISLIHFRIIPENDSTMIFLICIMPFSIIIGVISWYVKPWFSKFNVAWWKGLSKRKKILLLTSGVISIATLSPIAGIIFYFLAYTISSAFIRKKKNIAPVSEKINNNPYALQTAGVEIPNPFRGVLVVGSAGSGKSRSVFSPLITSALNKGYCGILYDFKFPTLTEELYANLKKENSNIQFHAVNFDDLTTTSRLNPLHPSYILNSSYAREYATVILNNTIPESATSPNFWTRSAIDLLTAIILFNSREIPDFSSLPHAVAMALQDEAKLVKTLTINKECAGMIRSLQTALHNKAGGQLSGVISTLQSGVALLNTPEIFYVLSGNNDINLDINNEANPTWLALGNNPTISGTYAPIIALIISACTKLMNQKGKHHSLLILDEGPTLSIPNLDVIPATARSNKVGLVYGAQDLQQMESRLGKNQSDMLLGLLNNQFYGRLSHIKSTDHVSKLFGKYDKEYTTQSQSQTQGLNNSSRGSSASTSVQQRDRIQPQDVLGLRPGQFVGVLVESEKPEFVMQFKDIEPISMPLPKRPVNIDIDKNFEKIHNEVEAIVNA